MYRDGVHNAQRVLAGVAGYAGAIDGDPGPASQAAALRVHDFRGQGMDRARRVIAAAQLALVRAGFPAGSPDGFYGPQTDAAFVAWSAKRGDLPRGLPDRAAEDLFGAERDMRARFGPPGGARCTAGKVDLPWRMVLAWDQSQVITRFSCHEDVAPSAQRALERAAEVYTPAQIRDLGLHLFGGCYNFRKKRGGTSLSTHAFGLAIDFDPARNRLTWTRQAARLAKPDAAAWWRCWEAEGWHSLGRLRNYDWMHVQAVAP